VTIGSEGVWASVFEAFLAEIMARDGIPGVAVGAARNGDCIYEKGFGYRDAEQRLPVTSDTVFGVASVSKSFTALAVMQLQERGVLSVEDPIQKWLPEFALPHPDDAQHAAAITIHQCLTHTSGLPREAGVNYVRAGAFQRDPDARTRRMDLPGSPLDILEREPITTYDELLALLPRLDFRLVGAPGERWHYSSDGYALLGAVVGRAAGQRLPAYVREHILAPLRLTRTGSEWDETPPAPPVAQLYAQRGHGNAREIFASPHAWDYGQIYGPGGMYSTTNDLLRYLELYRTTGEAPGPRIVSSAAIVKMLTPYAPTGGRGYAGYGLRVWPGCHGAHGATVIQHGGGYKGISANMLAVPERGLTVAALANLGLAALDRVSVGLMNCLIGIAPGTPLSANA
jgi:CubicO group peptidase (beta-lactamase class C family)